MSGGPDEFADIDEAVKEAHDHVLQGHGAEPSTRALLPLAAILLRDLRRLADAAERIAEAVEDSPAPKSPRG